MCGSVHHVHDEGEGEKEVHDFTYLTLQ
jgi:hypothetical protein